MGEWDKFVAGQPFKHCAECNSAIAPSNPEALCGNCQRSKGNAGVAPQFQKPYINPTTRMEDEGG